MSTEWGIFTDEGKAEGDFYDRDAAQTRLDAMMADPEDCADCESEHTHVGECCEEHPENERETCEECNAEDPEDDSDEEDVDEKFTTAAERDGDSRRAAFRMGTR